MRPCANKAGFSLPSFVFPPQSSPGPPAAAVLLSLGAHQTVADNVSELRRQEIQIGY